VVLLACRAEARAAISWKLATMKSRRSIVVYRFDEIRAG
jgi:hypothetical protein